MIVHRGVYRQKGLGLMGLIGKGLLKQTMKGITRHYQHGQGLFGDLLKMGKSFGKSTLKTLGKNTLQIGTQLGQDILAGKKPKEAVISRGKELVKKTMQDIIPRKRKIETEAVSKKIKRRKHTTKRQFKIKPPGVRKQSNTKDIFS